jgi:hypothetical protein
MRISNAFPSDYLKAADLQGRNVTVIISHVEMKEIGGEPKPILFFVGKEKGMVLNKTNASKIAEIFGDETDGWQGGEVVLYEAMVDFQGKTVAAIRIRVAPRRAVAAQAGNGGDKQFPDNGSYGRVTSGRPAPTTDDPRTQAGDPNDDIPF